MHCPELGIEIAPARVSIERHGQSSLRSFHPHQAGIRSGAFDGVSLYHRVVLLEDPALRTDVRRGKQLLQIVIEILLCSEADCARHFARDRSFPFCHWPVIDRSFFRKRMIGNISDDDAMLLHSKVTVRSYATDCNRVESPFLEDPKDLVFAPPLCDEQHALLRFAEHDLVGVHAAFALRDKVEFDLDPDATTSSHLTSRTSEAGGAHILNADNCSSLHRFKTSFQQQFFEERITNLDVRTLLLRAFLELFARHGGAVNAVASGLSANVDHRIAFTCRARVENLVAANQSQREGIHQRIAGVAALKLGLASEVGHAKAVAIGGNSADHSLENGVVLVND